ncbi:MAG TPA: hypothetical protein VM146_11450 [Steroidobacteraceae bacterium]|nr:hypothetical protein [Steroidobacteraceae bacterium]
MNTRTRGFFASLILAANLYVISDANALCEDCHFKITCVNNPCTFGATIQKCNAIRGSCCVDDNSTSCLTPGSPCGANQTRVFCAYTAVCQ